MEGTLSNTSISGNKMEGKGYTVGGLNYFCRKANEDAIEKGFWDGRNTALNMLARDRHEKLSQCVDDAFIVQKISLISKELHEAIERMRQTPRYEGDFEAMFGVGEKDSFADFLANAFIRLADLCGQLDIDIEAQILFKTAFNAEREVMNGKEF